MSEASQSSTSLDASHGASQSSSAVLGDVVVGTPDYLDGQYVSAVAPTSVAGVLSFYSSGAAARSDTISVNTDLVQNHGVPPPNGPINLNVVGELRVGAGPVSGRGDVISVDAAVVEQFGSPLAAEHQTPLAAEHQTPLAAGQLAPAVRLGDVFIPIPPALGGAYRVVGVGPSSHTNTVIAVDPTQVNHYSALTSFCPPPAVVPCAGSTLNTACAPPQTLTCQTQCTPYAASPGSSCPYPALTCSRQLDPPSHIGCSWAYPAPGTLGCRYPCPAPPSAVAASQYVAYGRTMTIVVNPAQVATGAIATYGCCPPSASSLAPRGPTTDNTFICS